jgi:SAM-dependent methyltransferase
VPDYALQLSDGELVRYEMMAARAHEHEREQWAAAGVVEGAVVADIGCGPGAMSIALARQVGPSGRVLAFDRAPEAVDMARAVAAGAGVENVTFEAAPADATGVAPGTVDVVMIRHVLAHNGGREAAIVGHAATLVRPGGCVYLIDTEGSGVRVRPSDPDLDDLNDRYWLWHLQQGNDSSVGLRLAELLAGAGLEVIEFSGRYDIITLMPGLRPPPWAGREALVASGLATAEDVARWAAAFARADDTEPSPTIFVPMFCGIGVRPLA